MSGGQLPPAPLRPSHQTHQSHQSLQSHQSHLANQPTNQPPPHPTQAWNHLQVPNFYQRQPQAAHMSSDRPLSHSPLTWHTPTPPEHQQSMKSAPNLFRHTPTPPDIQILKSSSNPMFRHTPTPPDRDTLKSYRHTPTPPDVQSIKSAPNSLYRHTPTPPDIAHSIKSTALFRHTPPPDGHKGPSNPLFNLQQMISDNRNIQAARANDPLRDNFRADALGFSRQSPSLVLGSMDLSVTRSPKNGNQNGETGLPISLSVRDATKINSLDSAEITKIHQVPSGYSVSKAVEFSKSSSPTPSCMSQSSNSPKSPKPTNKRPLKKVDSILERLNSGSDGVVIMPIQHIPSPHSVIVSAHSLEDSNSRGSSSSCNITPVISSSSYPPCEISNLEKATSLIKTNHPTPSSENSQSSLSASSVYTDSNSIVGIKEPHVLESHSVIKESIAMIKDEMRPTNYLNDDSNGSSSDSSRSRRRRKQLKTTKVECEDKFKQNSSLNTAPQNITSTNIDQQNSNINNDDRIGSDVSRVSIMNSQELNVGAQQISKQNSNNDNSVDNRVIQEIGQMSSEENSISVVSKARRKTCSESETIDDIAAMIASTNSPSTNMKEPCITSNIQDMNPFATLSKSPVDNSINDSLDQVLGSSPSEQKIEVNNISDESHMQVEPIKIDNQLNSTDNNLNIDQIKNETKQFVQESSLQDQDKSRSKTTFVEVENELEKMFAGIEEADSSVADKTLSMSIDPTLENDSIVNETPSNVSERPTKKKRGPKNTSDGASTGLLSSDENTPKKRQKPTKRKAAADSNRNNKKKSKLSVANKKVIKKLEPLPQKDAYDSGSNASSSKSRGPYVQIKGPRDSPLSVNVINTPIQEEDIDKPLQKIRNLKGKMALKTDVNFRNKVKSKGLHTSTLSMKYDATTTDTSWICVFCKRGPHTRHNGNTSTIVNGRSQYMGDLFGPYIVTTDCPDYSYMMSDPHDTLFKGKINRQNSFLQNKQSQRGKKIKLDSDTSEYDKTIFPTEEMHFGMIEAGANSFEIWLHEECAVWAPGLYLLGPKVVGLETAVWSCCTMRCDLCSVLGATVACVQRGCQKTMHVNCARTDMWSLSEDNFMVYCNEHKLP